MCGGPTRPAETMLRQRHSRAPQARRFAGWRRVALINASVLAVVSVVFLGFFVAAVVHTGGLQRTLIFFTGDCDAANGMDIGLHLLLNAFSTAILASSNFFMQVLNAPSRHEIDVAHKAGKFLHIGVASLRNAFGVAQWKTWAWMLLALSSVPIHLLFNSAIFVTDWRDSEYHLTIATEGFAHGDPFFVPGASLSPAGMSFVFQDYSQPSRRYGSSYEGSMGLGGGGLDSLSITFPDYTNHSKPAWGNITDAAAKGASWVRLERLACAQEYAIGCRGVREYGNLLLVIDRQNSSWAREDVWDFDERSSRMWDTAMPASDDNSLWYAARCAMVPVPSYPSRMACTHSCGDLLTSNGGVRDYKSNWSIDFFPGTTGFRDPDSSSTWPWASETNGTELGIRPGKDLLRVDYCLAEPVTQECSVGLSNVLLFAVMLCVCVKAITCSALIFAMRRQDPLVTLGDAIESFIVTPDTSTIGGSLAPGTLINSGAKYHRLASDRSPVQWRDKPRRGYSSIPWHNWTLFSIPLVLGVVFTTYLVLMAEGTM